MVLAKRCFCLSNYCLSYIYFNASVAPLPPTTASQKQAGWRWRSAATAALITVHYHPFSHLFATASTIAPLTPRLPPLQRLFRRLLPLKKRSDGAREALEELAEKTRSAEQLRAELDSCKASLAKAVEEACEAAGTAEELRGELQHAARQHAALQKEIDNLKADAEVLSSLA